ncbi:uncharacterized protein EDB91DRAFT_1083567 [Suillus paluster]|uniref:uncharacterized protein n=1 Tax=Suillus paluster TaxID=48578 RepID=UPI001B8766DC|nr:uncharacterized protein EDB91DRAFT_1083567 [Suillus paluster]KAG1735942.1 hypothetical protein EDB91DRAFT_1083567 [Suillus paluster]
MATLDPPACALLAPLSRLLSVSGFARVVPSFLPRARQVRTLLLHNISITLLPMSFLHSENCNAYLSNWSILFAAQLPTYGSVLHIHGRPLGAETRHIWNAPWTVVKAVFLINRYGNLVGQTFIRLEEAGLLARSSQAFCRKFTFFVTYFMILSTASIRILVLTRAWAICGTQKRAIKILVWSYMSCILMLIGAATYSRLAAFLSFVRSNGCDRVVQYLQLEVTQICVGEMPILFALTMRSLRRYSREFQRLYPSDLLRLLVQDAIMFFIVSINNCTMVHYRQEEQVGIFSDTLILTSWTVYSKNPKNFLARGFASPLLSVAGQRLVLNLRSLKTRTYSTRELSREVDRQLEAFAEANSLPSRGRNNTEGGQELLE